MSDMFASDKFFSAACLKNSITMKNGIVIILTLFHRFQSSNFIQFEIFPPSIVPNINGHPVLCNVRFVPSDFKSLKCFDLAEGHILRGGINTVRLIPFLVSVYRPLHQQLELDCNFNSSRKPQIGQIDNRTSNPPPEDSADMIRLVVYTFALLGYIKFLTSPHRLAHVLMFF